MGLTSREWVLSYVAQLALTGTVTGFAAPNITSINSLHPTTTTSLPASITSPASLVDDSWEGRCWSSWNTYNSAEASYNSEDHPWDQAYTDNTTQTFFNFATLEPTESVPMTTLCDGFPRAIRPRTTTTYSTFTTTWGGWYVLPDPPPANRTDIQPTCTIDDESRACTRLWSSWNSASSVYLHQADYDNVRRIAPLTPPCMQPDWSCPVTTPCTVRAAPNGTIFYWPVTTVSGDLCDRTGTILTPTPTDGDAPNTVEYADDLTFTSPSVYVIIDTASADWVEHTRFSKPSPGWRTPVQWTHPCGPTVTAITLTLDPTDLSTVQGSGAAPLNSPASSSVNWADFNELNVRHAAYQFQCNGYRGGKYWRECPWQSKIWDDYSPYFSLPHEALGEADEWGEWNCTCDRGNLRPKMVSIEPGMGTSDDGERMKGRVTVKPIAGPTVGVAGVTGPASAVFPVSTGDVDGDSESLDGSEAKYKAKISV